MQPSDELVEKVARAIWQGIYEQNNEAISSFELENSVIVECALRLDSLAKYVITTLASLGYGDTAAVRAEGYRLGIEDAAKVADSYEWRQQAGASDGGTFIVSYRPGCAAAIRALNKEAPSVS